MKIYKAFYYSKQESSQGFSFHTSMSTAKKALSKFKNTCRLFENPETYEEENDFDDTRSRIEQIELKCTLKGIVETLNIHASHNDNG